MTRIWRPWILKCFLTVKQKVLNKTAVVYENMVKTVFVWEDLFYDYWWDRNVRYQLFRSRSDEKEVKESYFFSALANVIVSVAWRFLNGRSVSSTVPSVRNTWLLVVLNFVSTSCLRLYLNDDRYVFIAFQAWVFKIQMVAHGSKRNSIYRKFGSIFCVGFFNGIFNRLYQLVFGWVSSIMLVVSTNPTSKKVKIFKELISVIVLSKEAAWKPSFKISTTWSTVGSGVDDRAVFPNFWIEFCCGGVMDREWFLELCGVREAKLRLFWSDRS